jgi:hypothetical protein
MYPKPKILNIAQQMAGIKMRFPRFEVSLNNGILKAFGSVQPTERSVDYNIKIRYDMKGVPQVIVLSPQLKRNDKGEDIPHMYSQKRLCLYQPKYGEFKHSDLISDTIIPWTSLWLYHYEIWHITGKWLGGGEHPE